MSLTKLIEAVKQGDGDFVASDGWIEAWDIAAPELQTYRHKSDGGSASLLACRAFHGSLDAAKRLHDALLPGWHWEICSDDESQAAIVWESGKPSREFSGERGEDRNPARAWLLSILRALEEEGR